MKKLLLMLAIALTAGAYSGSAQVYVNIRPDRPHCERTEAHSPRHVWIETKTGRRAAIRMRLAAVIGRNHHAGGRYGSPADGGKAQGAMYGYQAAGANQVNGLDYFPPCGVFLLNKSN